MRGHHHLTDRQWISYMGERNERAARIAKLRDERIDSGGCAPPVFAPRRRAVRYAVRVVLAFNLVVFALCVWLVIR
jgi:hypothetical protein